MLPHGIECIRQPYYKITLNSKQYFYPPMAANITALAARFLVVQSFIGR
jgi:hypothetical protein